MQIRGEQVSDSLYHDDGVMMTNDMMRRIMDDVINLGRSIAAIDLAAPLLASSREK